MCSVSAVSDYYTRTFPDRFGSNPFNPVTVPAMPMSPHIGPYPVVDSETKEMMRQALKLLDKIDKKLGDIECMDDAKKAFLATLGLTPDDIGAK